MKILTSKGGWCGWVAIVFMAMQAVAQDVETVLPPIRWTFPQTGPVIRPGFNGAADTKRAAAGSVVQDGDFYHMYYWGQDKDNNHHICHARTRVDEPTKWEPLGVVLGGAFPAVVKREGAPWLMYYAAKGINVATSEDNGKTWLRRPESPVVTNGSSPAVIIDREGQYRMYYTAFGPKYPRPEDVDSAEWKSELPEIGIGYAVSGDGIHWTEPLRHFLISPRRYEADPYEFILSRPFVLVEPAGYRLWANSRGTVYRVRELISLNALNWLWVSASSRSDCELAEGKKDAVPVRMVPRPGFTSRVDGVLGHGSPGAFDDVQRSYICVVKHGDEYRCWFTGNNYGMKGMGYAVGKIEPEKR